MRKAALFTIFFIFAFIACLLILNAVNLVPNFLVSKNKKEVLERLDSASKQYPPIPGSEILAKAAAKISPSVVNIEISGRTQPQRDFFGRVFPPNFVIGKGSGVIISPDGFLVTNNHVVQGADTIKVKLSDGRSFIGKTVGRDPDTDLAVVKISGSNLPAAEFGDSDTLQVAQQVIAVGNPLGFENTVTSGIVSALHRNFEVAQENRSRSTRYANVIQTDASINHGNSGGALANIYGQLIGINAVIAGGGENSGSIGIGFAIPVNTVKRITRQLIQSGRVTRPWLGILYTETGTIKEQHPSEVANLDGSPNGLFVSDVIRNSPAMIAGIQPNDVIISFNDKPVTDRWEFATQLEKLGVGETIMLKIWRDGKEVPIQIKLGKRPEQIPS